MDFLEKEEIARDSILFRRIYFDIAGDLETALIISQIIYWHMPAQNGASRLRVKRNGRFCLVKKNSDWWEECRVPERSARRSLKKLSEKGIITTAVHKFSNTPMVHIWLEKETLNRMISEKNNENLFELDKMAKLNRPNCPNEPGQNGQIFITDTTTETTSEKLNGSFSIPQMSESFDKRSFNINNVKKVCKEMKCSSDYVSVVDYYFDKYCKYIWEEHPVIKQEYWYGIIERIAEYLPEEIMSMIDEYFNDKNMECDCNIIHFSQEMILLIRSFAI